MWYCNDMKIYGIRNIQTKSPLRISIFSNDGGEFCNSCGALFETSSYDESIYFVKSLDVAERALSEDPDWFNASLERPQWPSDFNPLDYEVFSVDI